PPPRPARRATATVDVPCASLEAEADGKMQAPLTGALAVRDIGAERADRRAPAHACAVADGGVEKLAVVEGVAGIDENGGAEITQQPPRGLDAAYREVT